MDETLTGAVIYRMPRTETVVVETWFRNLCLVPSLVLFSVHAEALSATVALGHWPVPSVDDPKYLATAPMHLVSTALVLLLYPLSLMLVVVALKNWRVVRYQIAYSRWCAIFVLGWAGIYLSSFYDPGGVWYWWWD